MNSDTGQWVPESEATPDMNTYELGQVVECNGDWWEVEAVESKIDGGRLTLRALDKKERGLLIDVLTKNMTGDPVRNRSERRKADRKLRKLMKANGQRG